jgi:membrane fusion protein (multidrug efflux system)
MQSLNKSLAMLLLGALLSGCTQDQAGEPAPGPGGATPPPPEVEVLALTPRPVSLDLQYSGRAIGSREVEVRARVDGILLTRNYQEGSAVKAGDTLFEIDPQPYRVALERANAQLQQAEAQLRTAERDWERAEAVFAKGAISEADHDSIRSAYELAEAGVALARAEREAAQINLGYTTVTAPISGVTSREAVSEGSLVGPSQGMSLLTSIVQTDPLYVVFAIPESEYATLRRLRPESAEVMPLGATLLLSDGSVGLEGGSIDFTASTVDATTGTVQARAVFPNPGNQVLPGQFARVSVMDLNLGDSLLVPQAAVMQGPQGTFVLGVDAQNLVQFTPITTGMAVGTDWLVTSGLSSGMRIITNGLLKVQPGMPVTPVPAATPNP